MSRITESQRMLIRSEVRHMLNRSLLREANIYEAENKQPETTLKLISANAGGYDYFSDDKKNITYAFLNQAPYPIYSAINGADYTEIKEKDEYDRIFDLMLAEGERVERAANTPEKSASSSKSNSTVVKIQELLKKYYTDLVVDGDWGPQTDKAWVEFITKYARLLLEPSDEAFITSLSKDWASNSSKITAILDTSTPSGFKSDADGMFTFITAIDFATSTAPDATPIAVAETVSESRWLRLAGLLKEQIV